MSGLYPPSVLARTNSAGGHLTQHQQLYAQQQQQQQALLQQQQLQQQHALYTQQQRTSQPPPSYRTAPPPPAPLQQGSVPGPYGQQRGRYEVEQTWGGDRADPSVQNRYAQPAPPQRQQLMHSQHQQQQLYRLQQHQLQQQQQQQQQAHGQPPLDDRSPSPHLYLSADFLDLTGERHSNSISSSVNSNSGAGGGYMDRLQQQQAGSSVHRASSSTGPDLSNALAGLGVGVGGGSSELGKGKSGAMLGGSSELSGFDETVEMYEYRMQQQQQAQAQQLRGRAMPPPSHQPQLSQQQQQGSQASLQSGMTRVGSAHSYNTAAPMYSLYSADSMTFARSGSESLASNLTQDLMGSLSSSTSLLFTTSPHTPLSPLAALNNNNNNNQTLGGAGVSVRGGINNTNNNNSTNNTNDPVDTSGDFLQEHYNQFS